jgi:transitional endoplasmic reticulum ATPase
MKRVIDLLQNTGHYKKTFQNFANVFGIKLWEYYQGEPKSFTDYQQIDDELYNYFIRNKSFLDKFRKDWHTPRSMADLQMLTNHSISDIVKLFREEKIITNRIYYGTTFSTESTFCYFSSYQVLELLTGTPIIERPNSPQSKVQTAGVVSTPVAKESAVTASKIEVIGYQDIKAFIIDELAPIIYPDEISDWGLNNPGGILLYGPPGCGKTLWANWIAEFLNFEFIEIPRSTFGSSYVDGAMLKLKALLDEIKEKENVVLFFDEFDSVAPARTSYQGSGGAESNKIVNTLLQEIPKLIKKRIILVAATNFIESLDPAVIRPGRFDLKLPIFPPLPSERFDLFLASLSSNLELKKLDNNSPLLQILQHNNLLEKKSWTDFTTQLLLFSNSQLIDAASIIKRKIKALYKANNYNTSLSIPKEIITQSIGEARAKITSKDILTLKTFLNECKNLDLQIFAERINALEIELEPHNRVNKRNPIGFKTN